MKTEHKPKGYVAWYWLSAIAFAVELIGAILGGTTGKLLYVAGNIIFFISLIEAVRGGLKGDFRKRISLGNRIGTFLLALLTSMVLAILAEYISMLIRG